MSMRIANSTIARNYTRNLNRSQVRMAEWEEKSYTWRRFNSMSENTAAGVRAMELRRGLARLDTDRDNANSSLSLIQSAESFLTQGHDIIKNFHERIVQANNDTAAHSDRLIMANELSKMRDQMVNIANARFSDRYLFGGTDIDNAPFTYDKSATPPALLFRGEDVMTTLNPDSVLFDSAKYADAKRASYVDIGLGLSFDASGNIDPNTAFRNSFDGLAIFGEGDKNLIVQMDQIIAAISDENYDNDSVGAMLDELLKGGEELNVHVTQIGADTKYLEFIINRMDAEEINLQERQKQVEAIDPAVAIMNFKMEEAAYNAALQMGQRVMMPTLWDYVK